jgi:bifunctional non-homologous end joining protein LigD
VANDDMALPRFIVPMLAESGEPFDSPDYLFEIKWDGTRCLCFVDEGSYRLVNRRQIDLTHRYPDLATLAAFPAGTAFDGELVVLKDGKPDFALLQSRDHSRTPMKIRGLSRSTPATYIVFDLLYDKGESILDLPLEERRRRLEKLLLEHPVKNVVLSQGIANSGIEMFRQTTEQGLEGVMAKRLNSRYLPGRRTSAWIKIKKGLELFCLVIGFEPSGKDDFRNLMLARQDGGELRVVGKVGTGFDVAMRKRLNAFLWSHLRPKPVIPCKYKGKWVKPQLVCRVTCMELTPGGEMRAPVFHELVKE